MNKPARTGWHRLFYATRFSLQGLRATYRSEIAFRHELFLAIVLVPAALWLARNGVELALLWGSIILVLLAELFNSALEAVVDRIGTEYHELSGRAKDIGSAAVFLAIVNGLMVWGVILIWRA